MLTWKEHINIFYVFYNIIQNKAFKMTMYLLHHG